MRATLLIAGLTWGLTSQAEARCGLPKLELLWSYTTAGAVEVPTNAELWLLLPWAWGNPRPVVRLDGQALALPPVVDTSRGQLHLKPGALLPEHDYVLQLDFTGIQAGSDAGGPRVIELAFRTGTGTASAPAAPVLGALSSTEPLFYDVRERIDCPDVHFGQECRDTGPNTAHRWEATGPAPLAWLVGEHVIPARCGAPQALGGRGGQVSGCLDVRAIGAGGLTGEPTQVCLPARTPLGVAPNDAGNSTAPPHDASVALDPEASADDGCSVARGGGLGWTLLALLRRRRRR